MNNKLVPFKDMFGKRGHISSLSKTSVVVDEKGVPLGFVFGRDAFIAFLDHVDTEFEKRARNSSKAYDNPAGRLIDLIEEKLPLRSEFIRDLKQSIKKTKKEDWIPLREVMQSLHV